MRLRLFQEFVIILLIKIYIIAISIPLQYPKFIFIQWLLCNYLDNFMNDKRNHLRMTWKQKQGNSFSNLNTKVMTAISLIFICVLLVLNMHLKTAREEGNLEVKLQNGRRVKLPHLNQIIINPSRVSEKQIGLMRYENITLLKEKVQQIKTQQDFVNFSATLFEHNVKQENKLLSEVQYYRLNSTYDLDSKIPEKQICILAPFHNILKYGSESSFNVFLKTVNSQNYSNYHVYMIDDASTDNSIEAILQRLSLYPRLNNRITIIKNRQHLGPLANRDSVTRNYCSPGSIVADIDGDDGLIGNQVFNLFNRLYYNNPEAWYVYTNYLNIIGEDSGDGRGRSKEVKMINATAGVCTNIPKQIIQRNAYRTDSAWLTSMLRSYLRDLYVKIPLSYVLEIDSGKYFYKASDRFSLYALVQLAGPKHTFYFNQFSYFYFRPNYMRMAKLGCQLPVLFYFQALSRIQIPFKNLESLSSEPQVTEHYYIPERMQRLYIDKQRLYLECMQEEQQISHIYNEDEE